jgi:hypothetical protein
MAYSVLNAKADLTAIIHGTTLNKVRNLNGLFNRAARQLLADLDPQETIRYVETGAVFSQVYDYAAPTDLKGTKIIDIIPQVNRNPQEVFLSKYNQAFDIAKNFSLQDMFTVIYNQGIRTLRMNFSNAPAPVVIDTISAISDNGTYSVGGGATGLIANNQNFVVGGGSLQFNLSAGQSTGYLENSTLTAVDLTDELNQGTQFLFVYLPSASSVTAVTLRWGSSSGNYYSVSTSVTQSNTTFQNGWNLLAFPWTSATTTGSPDVTSITYVRVTFTYDSTLQTGVLVNGLTSQLGSLLNMEYYSEDLFRDAITGGFQATVTDDSNLINLGIESYNIFLDQLAYLTAQQLQGLDALFFDANFFSTAYQQGIQKYKNTYKSQVQKPQTNYYVMPPKGYTGYLPRRWR